MYLNLYILFYSLPTLFIIHSSAVKFNEFKFK